MSFYVAITAAKILHLWVPYIVISISLSCLLTGPIFITWFVANKNKEPRENTLKCFPVSIRHLLKYPLYFYILNGVIYAIRNKYFIT